VVCDRKSARKTQPKITVKYSAARLREKGIILEIEALPHSQYVVFVIFIVLLLLYHYICVILYYSYIIVIIF